MRCGYLTSLWVLDVGLSEIKPSSRGWVGNKAGKFERYQAVEKRRAWREPTACPASTTP